ncbi:MAG: transcriptional repressor [Chloroflexi bacterium]|nr:transcriptional repressor [Chloroflexota bacterium]
MAQDRPPLAATFRRTLPRQLVWESLVRLGPHCTAEDIASDLANHGIDLPRSSVYRALEALDASGAIRAVHLGSGATRYEVSSAAHHHAVCQQCHRIFHIEGEFVRELELHLEREHHFLPLQSDIVVIGLCPECRGLPVDERHDPEPMSTLHPHYSAN